MQSDERFFSRGNVAVAALLLVTAIGAAAVALDSVRLQNVRSQVAAGEATKTSGASGTDAEKKDDAVKGPEKCVMGYDYVVRMDDKGVTTVKPTLGKPELKGVDEKTGNHCGTPPKEAVYRRNSEGVIRQCDASWKCDVWLCIPGKLTANGKEECTIRESDVLGVGKTFEPGKYKALMGDRIVENINTAEPKRAAEIHSASKVMDSSVSGSIFDSMGGEPRREELKTEINVAEKTASELRALANDCSPGLSDGPDACASARAQAEQAEARVRDLRIEEQRLNETKKVLESGTNPAEDPTKCKSAACVDGEIARKQLEDDCKINKNQAKCNPTRFPADPNGNGGNPGGSPGNSPSGGASGFNPSQLMSLFGGLLSGAMQQAPTCTITASPKNIAQPGQPVTISWQSQNAQAAYISNLGQVGPSGSTTINPQQTTTVTMQVIGHPQQGQQQQNPYGGGYGQQQGQYVWNPQLGAYVYMQGQQQQQQNPYMQIGQQIGQAIGGGGGQQQAQCQTQVTVGADGGGGNQKAQISCQPKIADVGMQVAISYACQNSVASKGEGFATDNKLSGSAQATVASPTPGSTSVKYGLTCSKDGQTDSAECTVNVNKPSIVLVANPKNIKSGETSTIGWVTGAMESCIVSSPTLTSFTNENKNNTSTSGVAKTPGLTQNTKFVLSCTTKAGGTKTAETTVEVGN